MKHKFSVLIILVFLLTLTLTNCSFLPFFGPDANKIEDWLTIPKEGTTFIYTWEDNWDYDDGYYSYSSSYEGDIEEEIDDIEENDNEVIIEIDGVHSTDGFSGEYDYTYYLIMSKEDGAWAQSNDDDFDDDDDDIFLETPIEEGNDWRSNGEDYEIIEINATKTVDAGTFDDCIVVEITDTYSKETMYISRSKGCIILMEYEYKDDNEEYTYSMELKRIEE